MSEKEQTELREKIARAIYGVEHPIGAAWQHAACKPPYLDMAKAVLALPELSRLQQSNAALVEALKRLGSAEALTNSFTIPDNYVGAELKARIDFARTALAKV